MAAVTDAEAFRALHVAAKLDGLSIEPATAVAFAGLINMIQQRRIRPDELVVLNCSGHTFPVEKHVVGDQFTRDMDMSEHEAPGREEGLMTAVAALDDRVKRIVIVEDNPEASRLIRRILQTQGSYLLEEAVNGLEGLRLIRQTRPNLVILDLMMPGMDGFGVVEALRSDDATREIPIIVVTAKELTAVDRRRLQGKIDGLLQKGSFMDLDLLSDIQEALPES
jgi:threonine synthase